MECVEANHIIELLKEGGKLLLSDDGDEYYSLLSIEQRPDGLFDYHRYDGLLYDVVAPTQYTDRAIDQTEVFDLLRHHDYQEILNNVRSP
jgi:hypothetical protein